RTFNDRTASPGLWVNVLGQDLSSNVRAQEERLQPPCSRSLRRRVSGSANHSQPKLTRATAIETHASVRSMKKKDVMKSANDIATASSTSPTIAKRLQVRNISPCPGRRGAS